jgi:5-methylcytosine-specific restriction enzyme A
MAHLLYHWRRDNYLRDLDHGVGFHLNQKSPRLHDIVRGESLWAFTRNSRKKYVIAARLVVSAATMNPQEYRYGQYRIWGHLGDSKYFQIEEQPDITMLIRSFGIAAGSPGQPLGRAFQGLAAVRKINEKAHLRLLEHSEHIPLEPRARLLPEEELEAKICSGDADAVRALLKVEPSGLAEKRREYLYSAASKKRSRKLVMNLRALYSGRCQITGWNPQKEFGASLCEAHHVHWLGRGGSDSLSNMVLVSPNIHRAIHRTDAVYDYSRRAFCFEGVWRPLKLEEHPLEPA